MGSSGNIVRTLGPCWMFACSGTFDRSSDTNHGTKTDQRRRPLPFPWAGSPVPRDCGIDPSLTGDGDRRVCSSRTGHQAPSWLVFRSSPKRKHLSEIGREYPPSFNRVEIVGLAARIIERPVRRPEESDVRMRDRHATVSSTTHPLTLRISPAYPSPAMSRTNPAAKANREIWKAPVTGLYVLHDSLQTK